LVRGGIPISFMKINAASGPGRRFNLGRSMLAKPPNGRRATEYLHASRAAVIWLNPWRPRNLTIHTGSKTTSTGCSGGIISVIAARWWIDAKAAPHIASAARVLAGATPDASAAPAALHQYVAAVMTLARSGA
jgi:hypothetical protein